MKELTYVTMALGGDPFIEWSKRYDERRKKESERFEQDMILSLPKVDHKAEAKKRIDALLNRMAEDTDNIGWNTRGLS